MILNVTMNNNYLLTGLLLWLCSFSSLFAQDQVVLRIDSVQAPMGSSVCVPVIADSFPNIVSMQWSVSWDPDSLLFEEVNFGANPLDFDGGSSSMPSPNEFLVTQTPSDLVGITLAPGTVIYELCFTVNFEQGSQPLNFTGVNPPEFAQEGSVLAFPFDTIPGAVTIGIIDAVKEPVWGQAVSLYPNPYTAGPLTLRGDLPVLRSVALFDLEGRLVREFAAGLRQFDLTDVVRGMYLLRLTARDGVVSRRVVVR